MSQARLSAWFHRVIESSAGAPVSVRFGEQVMIMIASVRMYGAALNRWYPDVAPTDCSAGPSAAAPPNASEAHRHSIGSQRAKITSATAVMPCPLERPSFQLPG